MCSNPKEFQKTSEVLPFTKYGISTINDFKKAEDDIHKLEWLKLIGLSNEEIKLYQDNEAGLLDGYNKVESSILKSKLKQIYLKIKTHHPEAGSSQDSVEPCSSTTQDNLLERIQKKPIKFYPEGHPMNELKDIEESLFGHLKNDNIIPISKRRKILRRFERKKERILSQEKQLNLSPIDGLATVNKKDSLWDVKDIPIKLRQKKEVSHRQFGPKRPTMYTVKNNNIVRLEPVAQEADQDNEYRAVDIVVPVNAAEEQLLEGTKMCLDDIKKIERFKDYEPGIPSKVIYLKNIAPLVSQEQISLLFNQFLLENGGPVDVRLMTGRMRGQAFVAFRSEDLAIQALSEVNGTILSGRPLIAQFGRNSNRIQDEENR